jgi:hypothetical protein
MLDRTTKRAAKLAARRERDRRYKARCRRGERFARNVIYTGPILDLLLRAGALKPDDCDDATAVGKAITALLEASART